MRRERRPRTRLLAGRTAVACGALVLAILAGVVPASAAHASVAAGRATVTPSKVDVASVTSKVIVVFTAPATRKVTRQVSFEVPAGWTVPQTRFPSKPGFITTSQLTCNDTDPPRIHYHHGGPTTVLVTVKCAAGTTFSLTYRKASAPLTAGSYEFTTASRLDGSTTFRPLAVQPVVKVTAGPATSLAFGVQPTTTLGGTSITPSPTVRVLDAYGNLTPSIAAIHIAIGANPAGGILSGTVSVPATAGIATFAGLSIDDAGVGYTLQATSAGIGPATSSAFSVTTLDGTLDVTVADNSATALDGVHVSVLDGAVTVASGQTNGVGFVEFPGLPAGTYTVNASLSGYNGVTVPWVAVTPGGTTPLSVVLSPTPPPPVATVNVSVTDSSTGVGVGGATVTINYSDGSSTSGSADGNGLVTFTSQPVGMNATITATDPITGATASVASAGYVAGTNALSITIPFAIVNINVVDATDGVGFFGVIVQVYYSNGYQDTAQTDANGDVQFASQPPGESVTIYCSDPISGRSATLSLPAGFHSGTSNNVSINVQ
jgi:Carboxypeptidase regulatory-like domain